MKNMYLLYVDILGFSQMVETNPEAVKVIYQIVDSLNVHKHGAFQTIIFSDTILVYNKYEPLSVQDQQYIVMYMIEFVQDLIFRGIDVNLNFRAILTFGEFEHYKLKNSEYYFGKALVSAYKNEKEVNGIGLFIDKNLERFNKIYSSCTYNSSLNFVFIFQTMLRIRSFGLSFPIPKELIEPSGEFCWLEKEVEILKKYYLEMRSNIDPRVRSKYLQTYAFYKELMPDEFAKLEANDFSMSTINKEVDWNAQSGGCIEL